MRQSLVMVLLIATATGLYADIREKVFIIRPNILTSTKEQFLDASESWKDTRPEFAVWLEGFVNGGHGSGFIYVDEKGDNYIITNRHVVSHAESANIVQRLGRDERLFENCPIIYVSDTVDLAVLAFPNNEKVFKKGFSFYEPLVRDGDEVISAGYPGYGVQAEPLWQFARGYTTNSAAYIDSLLTEDVDFFIQHSANIDGGNSGGPLLVEVDGDYQVVGVNTFGFEDRDNTFFSIPSISVRGELEKAIDLRFMEIENHSVDSINQVCQDFVTSINEETADYLEWSPMISETIVSEIGLNALDVILSESSSSDAELLFDWFLKEPWEAMRYATIDFLIEELGSRKPLELHNVKLENETLSTVDPGSVVTADFLDERKLHRIDWVFEYGKWRISGYQADTVKKMDPEVYEQVRDEELREKEEQKQLEGAQKAREREQYRAALATANERYQNSVLLYGGIPFVVSSSHSISFSLGLSYWHRFRERKMYIAADFTMANFRASTIPAASFDSTINDFGYFARGYFGYTTMLTNILRLVCGVGTNMCYANISYDDPSPGYITEQSFGFGPSAELGLIWNLTDRLVFGYRLTVDGIYLPSVSVDNNTFLVMFNSLCIGTTW